LDVWLASPRGKFLEEREREHTINTPPAVAKKAAGDRRWPTAEDVTDSDESDDITEDDLNAIDLHGKARARSRMHARPGF
jgi:hypothetical protein